MPEVVYCEALFERLAHHDPPSLMVLLTGDRLPPHLLTYAAEVAGRIEAHAATEHLLGLLDHPSPMVREGAIYGLGDDAPWEWLRAIAETDPSPGVRSAARCALEWS